jgi:hypothetical protein
MWWRDELHLDREEGVKAGRRPPAGEALTARSVELHIMEIEAP